MTPQVKICGLTRPEDVDCAIKHGATYAGFIVEAKSKRRLSVTQAATLTRPVESLIKTVAVTVDADNDLLHAIVTQMQPDFIQCHGDESPHRVDFIRSAYGVSVIKAIQVKTEDDLKSIPSFDTANFILLDAKPPKGLAAIRGGHGVSFDWDLLSGANLPETYFLAGGLSPKNARTCVTRTKAPILDVSSGVESAPGIKDPAKIKAFMQAVKG